MSYGDLADFWERFGLTMGNDAGPSSIASGDMVQDLGDFADGGAVQGEVASDANEVDKAIEQLVSGFVSRIEKENWKDSGFYISDVYACESARRAEAVAKRLAERAATFRRGLIGISIHGDHVHSIHSCPYTSRSCRCYFKNFPQAKEDLRRLLRSPPALETFTRRDWENITKYFCTNGRRATFFKINGELQRIPLKITALSNSEVPEYDQRREGEESSLAMCKDPIELYNGREGEDIPARPRAVRRRNKRNTIALGGATGVGGVTGLVLDLLSKCAICPLSEIVYTKPYLENPVICTKRLNSKEVQDALDARASLINTWRRNDYVEFYNNPSTIKIWSARTVDDFDTYYMSYEESRTVALELLNFQMGPHLHQFCTDVIDILECNTPKRNCICIISAPSAGKNFFFDGVRDYYLNAGQMNNPNKYNQFAYQDCYNKRVIIWNEPNFEMRELEHLKMLFAGDNLSANVKCKPQANVKRTPVIVLSNCEPMFCRHHAFRDRVLTYHWKAAPWLKEYAKKPRPDAIVDTLYYVINEVQ